MTHDMRRLDWLDAAKGLGIILVATGHVWTGGPVRDTIYAFHMPLFFLLAGYVARPRPIRECVERQWASLAVPYIAFLVLLMIADPLIEQARGYRPMFASRDVALRAMILGGTELRGPLTIFWFVPCLMVARLIQNGLSLAWPSPRDWRWCVAMAVTLVIGLWLGAQTDFSPLGLLSVPVALVFLWLGAVWRTVGDDRWIVAVAALASAGIFLFGPLVPINMKAGDYGMSVWSPAIAVILSLGLCWLARILPWRPLRILGRMSLTIMFLHVAVIHYLAPYCGKPVLLVLSIILPAATHVLLARANWGRRLFLGKRAIAG